MLTSEQIAEIRARERGAMPGPWVTPPSYAGVVSQAKGDICYPANISKYYRANNHINDMCFIAHARQDIPTLLDALEDALADRDRWKERAEALERVIKNAALETQCDCCTKSSIRATCLDCDENYSGWQLDLSRYTGETPCPTP